MKIKYDKVNNYLSFGEMCFEVSKVTDTKITFSILPEDNFGDIEFLKEDGTLGFTIKKILEQDYYDYLSAFISDLMTTVVDFAMGEDFDWNDYMEEVRDVYNYLNELKDNYGDITFEELHTLIRGGSND